MIPGEMIIENGDIELNVGRRTASVKDANSGDRPIQVGDTVEIIARSMPYDPAIGYRAPVQELRGGGVYIPDASGVVRRFMHMHEIKRVQPMGNDYARAIDPTIPPLPPGRPAAAALPEGCERLEDDVCGPRMRVNNVQLETTNHGNVWLMHDGESIVVSLAGLRAFLALLPASGD